VSDFTFSASSRLKPRRKIRFLSNDKFRFFRTGRSSSAGEEKGLSAGPSGLDSSSESLDGDLPGPSLPPHPAHDRKATLDLAQVILLLQLLLLLFHYYYYVLLKLWQIVALQSMVVCSLVHQVYRLVLVTILKMFRIYCFLLHAFHRIRLCQTSEICIIFLSCSFSGIKRSSSPRRWTIQRIKTRFIAESLPASCGACSAASLSQRSTPTARLSLLVTMGIWLPLPSVTGNQYRKIRFRQ